ncbi:MAG: AAA family ATPase [Acidobacteria bacterium]|nr:AAA family ATPase [Acidobacteriota bacterium]
MNTHRQPLSGSRIAALLVSLILWHTPHAAPAPAREWYDCYENAEKALREQRWNEAEAMILAAARLRPDPGIAVATYGMKYVNYFPYLKLGIIYYNLGRYDAALQAFEREQKAGAVLRSDADRRNLETFRQLAQDSKKKAGLAEKERIQQAIAQNLEQARKLEQEGAFDGALAAASRASALDPSNKEAEALLKRVREKQSDSQRATEAEAHRTQLITDGVAKLDAGNLEEAATLFSQAQALKADSRVLGLLEDARRRLRALAEARTAEETKQLITAALADTRRFQTESRFAEALARIQTVLALDPRNADALSLQEMLNKAASDKKKLEDIARAMDEGVGYIQRGLPEKAAASFNWILGIDPANAAASANFLQALQQINSAITGGAPAAPKIVPIIVLANGEGSEIVRRPDVTMSGTVLDDGPELTLSVSTGSAGVTAAVPIKGQKTGNLYRFDFTQGVHVQPGQATLRVTAVDGDKLTAQAERRVVYVRPWSRSPWVLGSLAIAIALAGGGTVAWKARVRARALRRRYNPFVAGTPVIKEESFFGREPLMQRILQSVHNNSILLYGERRIGKTSIQHHLHKRMQKLQDPEYEFIPVYVDLQGVPQEKFFATLAADVFHELSDRIDPAYATRDPRQEDGYGYETFVRDLRAILKSLKARATKRVKLVLLIDEVDELNDYDPRVNQKLRSLFMKSFAEDLSAVVSGVAIKKHWESEGSPWYNFFEEIEVEPFTRADAVDLIERPIRGVFDIEPGVTDRIIELTNCRPYLIQKICMSIVSRLHEEKRRRITLDDLGSVKLPAEG